MLAHGLYYGCDGGVHSGVIGSDFWCYHKLPVYTVGYGAITGGIVLRVGSSFTSYSRYEKDKLYKYKL